MPAAMRARSLSLVGIAASTLLRAVRHRCAGRRGRRAENSRSAAAIGAKVGAAGGVAVRAR